MENLKTQTLNPQTWVPVSTLPLPGCVTLSTQFSESRYAPPVKWAKTSRPSEGSVRRRQWTFSSSHYSWPGPLTGEGSVDTHLQDRCSLPPGASADLEGPAQGLRFSEDVAGTMVSLSSGGSTLYF